MFFHIIDSGLKNRMGHHYHQNKAMAGFLEKKNIPYQIYGAKNIEKDIAEELDVTPLFRFSLYSVNLGETPGASDYRRDFRDFNQAYFDDLCSLDMSKIKEEDVILLHTANYNQMMGFAKWLQKFGDKMPYVFVILPFADFLIRVSNVNIGSELYHEGLSHLPKTDKILLTSTEDKICRIYSDLAGRDVSIIPVPIVDFVPPPVSERKSGPLRITYLGHGRTGKGTQYLSSIVRRAQADNLNVEFHIQLSILNNLEDVREGLERFDKGVSIYSGKLSKEKYLNLMMDADIIFLPYKKISYMYSTSGVFTEAMSLGKVVVVPGDTWIERELIKYNGGGKSFQNDKIREIYGALKEAVEDFETQSKKAKAAADDFRKWHNMDNFMNMVLEFAS